MFLPCSYVKKGIEAGSFNRQLDFFDTWDVHIAHYMRMILIYLEMMKTHPILGKFRAFPLESLIPA